MVAWLSGHASLLGWVGVLSVVMGVGTLVLAPLVVARLPVDYFTQARHPALGGPRWARGPRLLGRLGKNLLGVLVVLAGGRHAPAPGAGDPHHRDRPPAARRAREGAARAAPRPAARRVAGAQLGKGPGAPGPLGGAWRRPP